jgi:hypothetical protein
VTRGSGKKVGSRPAQGRGGGNPAGAECAALGGGVTTRRQEGPEQAVHQWIFAGAPFEEVIRRQEETLSRRIANLDSSSVLDGRVAELTELLVRKYSILVPVLQPDRRQILPPRLVLLRPQDLYELRYPGSRRHRWSVVGDDLDPWEELELKQVNEFPVAVPFEGMASLFRFGVGSNEPQAARVESTRLVLSSFQPTYDPDPERAIATVEGRVSEIAEILSQMQPDAAIWNQGLGRVVARVLETRRRRLGIVQSWKHAPKGAAVEGRGSRVTREQRPKTSPMTANAEALPYEPGREYDIFICHASEDKDAIARPLFTELHQLGFRVWFDEDALALGDSLHQNINSVLARCRFGAVILSRSFFGKGWPQRELEGLLALEDSGRGKVLPIWHDVTREEVVEHLPSLANRVAARSSEGAYAIAKKIALVLRGQDARH